MQSPKPTVFVVDPDPVTRTAVATLIRQAGWTPEPCASGEEVLIALSTARRRQESELLELRARHSSLTGREREVMARVVSGLLNKQVGAALGISVITVKAHRGKVMRKMRAGSLAELVGMALRLGIATAPTLALETNTKVQSIRDSRRPIIAATRKWRVS